MATSIIDINGSIERLYLGHMTLTSDGGTDGIYLDDCTEVVIENVLFDTLWTGIKVTGMATTIRIRNCDFINCGIGVEVVTDGGVAQGYDIIFEDCIFDVAEGGVAAQEAVKLHDPGKVTFKGCTFIGRDGMTSPVIYIRHDNRPELRGPVDVIDCAFDCSGTMTAIQLRCPAIPAPDPLGIKGVRFNGCRFIGSTIDSPAIEVTVFTRDTTGGNFHLVRALSICDNITAYHYPGILLRGFQNARYSSTRNAIVAQNITINPGGDAAADKMGIIIQEGQNNVPPTTDIVVAGNVVDEVRASIASEGLKVYDGHGALTHDRHVVMANHVVAGRSGTFTDIRVTEQAGNSDVAHNFGSLRVD
jgi:polygalacturonase